MKNITLNENGTFKHVWIEGLHTIPEAAIEVSDAVMLELSQNTQTKALVSGSVVDFSPAFNLAVAQETKKQMIRDAFALSSVLPVADVAGDPWSGGFDSALKMDAAKRMAELAGLPTVTLFDANNVPHDLTIAEAEAVILAVGADYQAAFAAKQAFMVAVDSLPSGATQADIDAILVTY